MEAWKDLLTWQEGFLPHPNPAMFFVSCVLNQTAVTDPCAFHYSLMVADYQSSEDVQQFQRSQILSHQLKTWKGRRASLGCSTLGCDLQDFARSVHTDLVGKCVASRSKGSDHFFSQRSANWRLQGSYHRPTSALGSRYSFKGILNFIQRLLSTYLTASTVVPPVCLLTLCSLTCTGTGQMCTSLGTGVKCEPASKLTALYNKHVVIRRIGTLCSNRNIFFSFLFSCMFFPNPVNPISSFVFFHLSLISRHTTLTSEMEYSHCVAWEGVVVCASRLAVTQTAGRQPYRQTASVWPKFSIEPTLFWKSSCLHVFPQLARR